MSKNKPKPPPPPEPPPPPPPVPEADPNDPRLRKKRGAPATTRSSQATILSGAANRETLG